ncbi:Uncharacterised protein [Burkholderia pseudomallei]|uniref:hypothetical protein n=1 Tax=Burkholderia ubonensis TaxID=101571 RepID=UPI0012F7D1FE|nr:hypothetical protein [Burkholderia ubonensis]CAJ6882864.1 Uncharacterised protein [Burkholderia pseudomallei]
MLTKLARLNWKLRLLLLAPIVSACLSSLSACTTQQPKPVTVRDLPPMPPDLARRATPLTPLIRLPI